MGSTLQIRWSQKVTHQVDLDTTHYYLQRSDFLPPRARAFSPDHDPVDLSFC